MVESVNELLESCQFMTENSNTLWKPHCTHSFDELRPVTNSHVLNCIMTEKQWLLYTKSCLNILRFVGFSEKRFVNKSLPQIIVLLNVKCQRSFVFCLCLFLLFTNEHAESFIGAFTGGIADSETLSEKFTCNMLNVGDEDFVKVRADRFMRLLRSCLESGQHLRCTAKKIIRQRLVCLWREGFIKTAEQELR